MKPFLIIFAFLLTACSGGESHNHEAHTQEIEALKAELAEARSGQETGLIHNVYFWLKEDITEEEKATFMQGARSLETIESVQTFYMGSHAETEARDVVDHSYDLSLVIFFEDQAAHDAYQEDPIHLAFIEESQGAWTEVKVYDVVIE